MSSYLFSHKSVPENVGVTGEVNLPDIPGCELRSVTSSSEEYHHTAINHPAQCFLAMSCPEVS